MLRNYLWLQQIQNYQATREKAYQFGTPNSSLLAICPHASRQSKVLYYRYEKLRFLAYTIHRWFDVVFIILQCMISLVAYRLSNFLTWLSNTPPTVGQNLNTSACTLCRQYNGNVGSQAAGSVNCPLTVGVFRYVIIQGILYDRICLKEVQVYSGQSY